MKKGIIKNITEFISEGINREIDPLTIKEFVALRDLILDASKSDIEFFKDEETVDVIIEKLRKLLSYGSEDFE